MEVRPSNNTAGASATMMLMGSMPGQKNHIHVFIPCEAYKNNLGSSICYAVSSYDIAS